MGSVFAVISFILGLLMLTTVDTDKIPKENVTAWKALIVWILCGTALVIVPMILIFLK